MASHDQEVMLHLISIALTKGMQWYHCQHHVMPTMALLVLHGAEISSNGIL